MNAVVRVLNKHLSDSEINALPAIVNEPKKSGSFAYVTVQLPFSDGQVVSVIFHSPEGDKKKITPSDTIIAFRWLLNKRDITHLVAPEDGKEVSLETIGKRVTQLVEKNSARFERTQKEAAAEKKALEEATENVSKAKEKEQELMDSIAALNNDALTVDAKIANAQAELEKQKAYNAELQAKIDGLKKAGQTGGNGGDKSKTLQWGKDEIQLLASSPTVDGIQKMINEYFFSTDSWQVNPDTLEITRRDGKDTSNYRVIKKGKRYRFEVRLSGNGGNEKSVKLNQTHVEQIAREFTDAELAEKGARLRAKVVAQVPANAIKKSAGQTAIETAQEWIEKNAAGSVQTEIGEVVVDANAIKNSLSHSMYQNKLDAVQAIVPVLQNGEYLGALPDKDNKEGS